MSQFRAAWRTSAAGKRICLLVLSSTVTTVALGAGPTQSAFRPALLGDPHWLSQAWPIGLGAAVAWLIGSLLLEVRKLHRRQEDLAKFSLIANKTDNLVMIANRAGQVEWVNDAFTRLSGQKLSEVRGKTPGAAVLGPTQNPTAIQRIHDAIVQQRPLSLEVQCAHKGGLRYWLAANFTPVLDAKRAPLHYVIVGTDITAHKKAEEELARLNRRNELLLQAAGEGICGVDLEGRISFVNPAVTRLTGWQAAELVGKPVSFLVHKIRRPPSEVTTEDIFLSSVWRTEAIALGETNLFRRKANGEPAGHTEAFRCKENADDTDQFRRHDGTTFSVEFTSTPLKEGANVVGAVVVFRDISDRRQTEAVRTRQTRQFALRAEVAMALTTGETLDSFLHRSAQAISKQLEGGLACIWVHNPDEHRLDLTASAGAEISVDSTQVRIAVGELTIGKLAAQRIPRLTHDLINEAAALEQDWLKHEALNSLAGYPMQVEGRLVGVLALFSRNRLPDDSIEALGSVADSIAQGIMRKHAEEKVVEQAALLDKARDAILVLDLSNRVVYWNKSAEQLYGWSARDAYGKRVDELMYRDSSYFDRARDEVMDRGEWRGELCQVNQGDEAIVVESQWTLVHDDAGQPKSILIVSTDIREKKQMEAQFLRTQRMDSIGTLAGGIAHDLNNVFAPILMSVELLKEKLKDEQSVRTLGILESSAKRGAEMVKQVLTFARGVDGERVLLQARHLIKEIAKIAGETFPKTIQVKTSVSTNLWTVLGDATQLHQVLLNLCVNARDALPNGGLITLSAENVVLNEIPPLHQHLASEAAPGSYVLIKVADTGTGIPSEVVDKIFEPFFTTKEMGKGTGLGLSTTLGIVKSHGGFVQVQTEMDKGTTFSIYLPASENAQAHAGDTPQKQLPSGRGELILAVDDEAAVLSMTKETLETFGYRVLAANDGAEAVATFSAHQGEIKAVVMDMIMPHMDGPTTVRVLKKLDPNARIIAASGLMDSEKVRDATGLEQIDFLMKPFTAERLLTAVHQAIVGQN